LVLALALSASATAPGFGATGSARVVVQEAALAPGAE
jgi:hypothetical protein